MENARCKIIQKNHTDFISNGQIIDLAKEEKINLIIPRIGDGKKKIFSSYFHKAILNPPTNERNLKK